MNIDHLKLFVRLASTNNISMAGQEMGLSPAVASAHINKLEEGLGVRLVHRTTRKVSLTQEGEAFLPRAEDVLASIELAKGAIGVGSTSPSGTLRITAPASFGRIHLIPALKGFLQAYPNLKVDLRFSDSVIDLVEGGFDLAIRNAELKDSTLVARKLAVDKRMLCASPEYIEQFGEPKHPNELKNHNCIVLAGGDNWAFKTEQGQLNVSVSGNIRTDNGDAMRDATADGLGISLNATWSAYQELADGRLIEILKDYPLASEAAIWAVYPSSRLIAPKVRAFIDYFADYYGEPPYWDAKLGE